MWFVKRQRHNRLGRACRRGATNGRELPQIQRVLKINELDVVTNDVVEAARSTLVIGTT